MSLVKTYQERVESYTTPLMSLVKTYQEHVEIYTPSHYTADKAASFLIEIKLIKINFKQLAPPLTYSPILQISDW